MDKFGLVMLALKEAGVPFETARPVPMPRTWIEKAHTGEYAEAILGRTLDPDRTRRIGFPITERVVRRSLLAVGGTYLAARIALDQGYAANSAGGSHHAHAGFGSGYCVLNDLAIASLRLLDEGHVKRVLIVDLDVHQGDGTASILYGRPDVFTLSLHAESNFPARKATSDMDFGLPDGTGDEAYLDVLEPALSQAIDRHSPDFIFYQAGVDVHAGDRLGRLAMTDLGLALRDRIVASLAARAGVPLASVMGGGYGRDRMTVARRHAATMLECNSAYLAARAGRATTLQVANR